MTKPGRNEPCHCGSGEKYKNCHGASSSVSNRSLLIGGGIVAVVLAMWFGKGIIGGSGDESPGNAPPGKVWSPEHGHFHDAAQPVSVQTETAPLPGTGLPDSLGQSSGIPGLAGTPQPPGEAPPGKIWSAEHGHWHEDNASSPGALQPPGEPPPGKEWSVEHGHWHDATALTPVDSLPAGSSPADSL
jgi:hypothetical protein